MSQDEVKYGGNVFTDLQYVAPVVHWRVEFDFQCEDGREGRMYMATKQKVAEAKDWSRDEINAWLEQEGFHMIAEPAAAEEVAAVE